MNQSRRIEHRLTDKRAFVRNLQAGVLLEDFFIAAVASVLVIRLYLFGIAYPFLVNYAPVAGRVVAGPIHFSHILWGGLLMLAAFVLLVAFVGRSDQGLAAVIGGIGFGAFIDSLGKLIAVDPNYFYQPAVALIYIIFVGLFLGLRIAQRPPRISERTALVNALQYAQQAVLHDFSSSDRDHAISLLDYSDPQHPMILPLRRTLEQTEPFVGRSTSVLARAKESVRRTYAWIIRRWWFTYAVVGVFVVVSVADLYQTLLEVVWSEYLIAIVTIAVAGLVLLSGALRSRQPSTRLVRTAGVLLFAALLSAGIALHLERRPESLIHWVQMASPIATSALVMVGILAIWRVRIVAYRMFHLAILISIFITQVFAFHDVQHLAVAGLAMRVLILMALRVMIHDEEDVETTRIGTRQAEPLPSE